MSKVKMDRFEQVEKDYVNMQELIELQTDFFNSDGEIIEGKTKDYWKLDGIIDRIGESFQEGLEKIAYAKDSEGDFHKARSCKYSICAIEVDGKKISHHNFFDNYKAYKE